MKPLILSLMIPVIVPAICLSQVDTITTRTVEILGDWPPDSGQDAYTLAVGKKTGTYFVAIYLPQNGKINTHFFGVDLTEKFDKADYRWTNDYTAAFRLYSSTTDKEYHFLIWSEGPGHVTLIVDDKRRSTSRP